MEIQGVGKFVLTHKDGTTETITRHNMIMLSGFDFICEMIGKGNLKPMSKICIGTSNAEVVEEDVALTEYLSESPAEYSHTMGSKVFTYVAEFLEGNGTGAIKEAGVFNEDDIMFDRVTFDVINKGADDKLTATFQFTLI